MSRVKHWTEIRELTPAPDNVPLQVRCLINRAAIVLPLMQSSGRWRHINRSPEERGAWLGAEFTPTHWQHFADPELPDPLYRVVRRCMNPGGHVACEVVAEAEALTFEEAVQTVEGLRRCVRDRWVTFPHLNAIYREFVIERDDDDKHNLSLSLADAVRRLEPAPAALERMAEEDQRFGVFAAIAASALGADLGERDPDAELLALYESAPEHYRQLFDDAQPHDGSPESTAYYYPQGITA